MMSDLLHQNFTIPQSDKQQPSPDVVASAATIAPENINAEITGTTDIVTVTPPVSGFHLLFLKFTNAAPPDILNTGNVKRAVTTIVQNDWVILAYDPINKQYDSIVSDTLATV